MTEAVAAGQVGIAGADAVCAALVRVEKLTGPGPGFAAPELVVGEDQIHGVLHDAVPALLGLWLGQGLEPADRTDQHWEHRVRLADVLTDAAENSLLDPADRLEPVFALLAEALAPSNLTDALDTLVDALRPEQLDADADEQWQRNQLSITRRPGQPGWLVRGELDDQTGTRLLQQLARFAARLKAEAAAARAARAPIAEDDAAPYEPLIPTGPLASVQSDEPFGAAPIPAGSAEPALPFEGADGVLDSVPFGVIGPGLPLRPVPCSTRRRPLPAHPVEGEPDDPSRSQRHDRDDGSPPDPAKTAADSLILLLDHLDEPAPDSAEARRSTLPPPAAQLNVVISSTALLGAPGAPPGTLQTPRGPVTIAPETARRLACGSQLAAVRLDQDGRHLDGSGLHRHATAAQRRAMIALWGNRCAVNGCTQPGSIPHHVLFFSRGGRTVLDNLAPVCTHHHHDIHEGHRTLRLRNGHLLTPDGYLREERHRAA